MTSLKAEVPLDVLFEGVEDDVDLEKPVSEEHDHADMPSIENSKGNGLSRLRKAGDTGPVDTPPAAAEVSRKDTSDDDDGVPTDDDVGAAGEDEGEYWDEEDEIEEHMRQGGVRGFDEDGGTDDENSDEEEDLALIAGDGTTRGDMNAETQRLLREVATKDRLGKGHKVQIKALSGLVDKLKKKKEEVFGKAAQLRAPEAPAFDDIISFAHETLKEPRKDEEGPHDKPEGVEEEVVADKDKDARNTINGSDPMPKDSTKGTIQSFFSTPTKNKAKTGGCEEDLDDDDLEVISSDEDEDEKLIKVPKLTPTKPSPLAFNLEYGNSGEIDDFEEEAKELFDDGAGSESDSESDHSWAVHNEENESVQAEVCSSPFMNKCDDKKISDDDEKPSSNDEGNRLPSDPPSKGLAIFSRMKNNMKVMSDVDKDSNKAPTKRSNFIDEEAELSDDEGLGIAVSDDEDDDNADVDQHGELKDLIDTEGNHQKDDATDELHIKWSRQQDAQQLKNILRGLENGFGRRKGGLLDDDAGEMNGRQRRIRQDDDDDDMNLDMAWPSLFGTRNVEQQGDGEECEDEAMLMKAAQRKLVESQSDKVFGSSIPLDEDSQHVLEFFSNSGSQPGRATEGLKRLRSRDKSSSAGSDPGGSSLSFIGRQSKVQRQQSTSNMGFHTNKSFVFGRKDSSQSRQGIEEAPTNTTPSVCAGPIDFSDLRQLTSQEENKDVNPNRSVSRLLKTLPRWNKPSNYKKKGSAHVIGAVCNQVAPKKSA